LRGGSKFKSFQAFQSSSCSNRSISGEQNLSCSKPKISKRQRLRLWKIGNWEHCSNNFVTLAALNVRLRASEPLDRITIKPDVCGGEPTIRGMRITASHVLEVLAGGMTSEQVLQDFPYLEKADIDACLEYAARHVAHREIVLGK
jgi:uncharacterized protein (DUF433 family)